MSRTDTNVNTSKKEKRYSDLALGFYMSPVTGNISLVTDAQSIKQAVKTMILTQQGERLYNNIYGSTIHNLLFDMIDPITADTLRMTIEESIRNFEPRIDTLQVQVTPDYAEAKYNVNIFFRIINIPEIQKLDLILKRVR